MFFSTIIGFAVSYGVAPWAPLSFQTSPLRVCVRPLITERLAAEIRSAAERRRMSGGEWVRHAIERALAEERGESDALSALSRLGAPTGDIEQILAEIEAGRTGEE